MGRLTWGKVHDHRRRAGAAAATDRRGEVPATRQAVRTCQHQRVGRAADASTSDRETLAALAATGGEDRTTRARAHAETEAVRLRATTVVRLVRTLAHEALSGCGWWDALGWPRCSARRTCGGCGHAAPVDSADRPTVRGSLRRVKPALCLGARAPVDAGGPPCGELLDPRVAALLASPCPRGLPSPVPPSPQHDLAEPGRALVPAHSCGVSGGRSASGGYYQTGRRVHNLWIRVWSSQQHRRGRSAAPLCDALECRDWPP